MNQSEAQNSRDDQKDRYNVIEQLRHNQDQDACDQRDDRLKVCDSYGHFLIPYLRWLRQRCRVAPARAGNELSNFTALTMTEEAGAFRPKRRAVVGNEA